MLSLNISPWKLFRWFRRLQLRATGDWQLHHDNVPAHASHLMHKFLVKHQITQVTQLPYIPDLTPCDFWFFPKQNHLWRGTDFRPSMIFRKISWGSWCWLGELCEVPRCLLWKVLRPHCPMYNVSCIFFNKCLYFSILHGYLLTRSCTSNKVVLFM